jgi:acetamidase/formamidase
MTHHRLEPQIYHTAIGSHEPVLHIEPGDTVSTTTVDAGGKDATNQPITPGGNPQTGPFYINGAEPGDTLVVMLDRLAPNRKIGFTAGAIAPNVLDFGYAPTFEDDLNRLDWEIDFENNTASPLGVEGLNNLKLPLSPMVGCFGVAPPRGQAISTATSSTHCGNDGHALQGDGEIVGTGLEISFEVTFTVHLLKDKTIGWPRAENETHIMTFGNARPLDQALQHATTEMVRWLQTDYGLDNRSTHVLLGQVVEYEVGNVFDPAYTMVCKVSKNILADISASRG